MSRRPPIVVAVAPGRITGVVVRRGDELLGHHAALTVTPMQLADLADAVEGDVYTAERPRWRGGSMRPSRRVVVAIADNFTGLLTAPTAAAAAAAWGTIVSRFPAAAVIRSGPADRLGTEPLAAYPQALRPDPGGDLDAAVGCSACREAWDVAAAAAALDQHQLGAADG